MSTIFISHSSKDNELAKAVSARLADEGHASVFLDLDPERGLVAGQSWERTLYRKLRACSGVIALCTPDYLASHWCFAEIALARMEGKHIFAIKAPGLDDSARLPSILTESQYIDMRTNPEGAYRRLWRGLSQIDLLGASSDWDPKDPPYLGLSAFHEKHAAVFFGREEETRAGIELLDRGAPGLIMALGPSGSGKSSLVRAGIVPRLRRLSDQWIIIEPVRPAEDPFRALAHALIATYRRYASEAAAKLGEANALGDRLAAWSRAESEAQHTQQSADLLVFDERVERLLSQLAELHQKPPTGAQVSFLNFLDWSLEDLRRICQPRIDGSTAELMLGNTPLVDIAHDLRRALDRPNARLLLVIDQFEELIESVSQVAGGSRFLDFIRTTIESKDSPITVLGTMRSDFLGAFQRHPQLRGIDFESLSLGPIKSAGMRRIIEEPARLGAIILGDGLVDRLIADTETPDALPLLSFTLWVLWRDYSSDGRIDLGEYTELDGLHGAISREADALLQGVDLEALRKAFVQMARLSDDGRFVRQPVNWESPVLQPVHSTIERFIDRRLLVSRTEDGIRTVEVAHEALLRSWPPLRSWLNDDRAQILLTQQVEREAQAWDESGRDKDNLWRGSRLSQARELLDADKLDGVAKAFVDKSLRQAQNLRRTLVATAVSVFVGMGILSVWALVERNRANDNQQKTAKLNESLETASIEIAKANTLAVQAKERLAKEYEEVLIKVLRSTPAYGAVLGEVNQSNNNQLRDLIRIARTESDATMALLGRLGEGRVIALAHDAFINANPENLLFFELVIKWASPNTEAERILYSVGHCEVVSYPSAAPDPLQVLPLDSMKGWNYQVSPIQDLSNSNLLNQSDLLIIGNAWASFTPAEIVSIVDYVRNGGALLLAGLKWSFDGSPNYPGFQPCAFNEASAGREIARGRYPMNDIANRVGLNFGQGALDNAYRVAAN
ncbi:MAG: TIR domain-containing protein [Burkholderiaceae bacterium]